MQLARALAYRSLRPKDSLHRYVSLPKQENEEEEAARLSVIQILSEQREGDSLRNTWHQIITEINPEPALSDLDGDVRNNLRSPDVVVSHAMAIRYRVKGFADDNFNGKLVSDKVTNPGVWPAYRLIDVLRGIQGRTTSRLEDETICLSVLLGLDVGSVTKIPVLHWKWKDLLAKLREFVVFLGKVFPHRNFFRVFVDRIERLLRRSHEDRMKVFLSQLEFLPKAILFWNTPRLQRKGWRWSPFSFLRKDLDIDAPLKGGPRGYLTEEGLFVKCSAIRLRTSSVLHRSDNLTQPPGRHDHLCIEWSVHDEEVQNDLDPANHELRTPREAKMVWKWIQLHQTVTWPTKVSVDSGKNVRSKTSDRLVILLEEDWKTGKKGALVSIHKKRSQCIYISHIMTLTAVEQAPNQPTLRAVGQWVPKRMWCVT